MVNLSELVSLTVQRFAEREAQRVVTESALAKQLRETGEREELRRWLAGEAIDIATCYEQTSWGT
jgi:hypothetical protein